MQASDIAIREATPDDFAEVAAMHYPVWRRSWAGILLPQVLDLLGPPKRWVAEIYPQSLQRRGWRMWVAEAGGRTLGVTIFGPDSDQPEDLLVDALYVAEESQRHGIGARMLGEVLGSHPSGDVILWCAEQNDRARRFYEKNNFRVDGRTLDWEPLPGIKVAHLGYRLKR
ncbi:GNAT family N-acetyltransferase [Mycobacterium sp. E3198]|uniref:GNAT family N-acetyltransferase n=1 Tax=Mycobacterium sp. E3198 TaxID=1834143 RepID=UPI0007FF024C|nr:GNAT family N-acetyltransferase [Mycobacterium sp. E3198]OBG33414.1 GNAT family acetyltransferase [Mycobacterium sp. E3198]